jgi:serine/threonine-protein kinase
MNERLTTPGTVLLGKYRVEKVLGQGAMGVVVAATNLGLNQRVAIKFMLPANRPDPERDERFLREARIAAKLTSQHVGKVLDVGTLEDGATRYLVMEHLSGQDLGALLDERGVLPFAEAVGYVLQVCEAVAEAHKAGIVHRDLKPANLFLAALADGSPCVKVLDFGVSKLTEAGGAELTATTAVLGSPLYMSPEQMTASRDTDGRSDIWALGVVLYQLIAGITPFHGDQIQVVCGRVFQGEPTPLSRFRPDAPPGLEAVLLRCYAKDREQRWQNAAELAAALVPFGPARSVVHAERAAAILGLNAAPQRVTDLLPPPPMTVVEARTTGESGGAGERSSGISKASAEPEVRKASRAPIVAVGFGLVALVVGGVSAALWHGGGAKPVDAVVVAPTTSTQGPVVAPAPSATASVGVGAGPIASAAPSAGSSAGVAAGIPAPRGSVAPHGPVVGKGSAAPQKKNPMERE